MVRAGILAAIGAAVVLACTDSGAVVVPLQQDGMVDTVVVEPELARATQIGATVEFRAFPLDVSGNELAGVGLSWSSSRPDVASVGPDGTAITHGEGEAVITATVGDETGVAVLSVDLPLDPLDPR